MTSTHTATTSYTYNAKNLLTAEEDALGNFTSSDFIALVSPLAALLAVVAVARGRGELPEYHGGRKGTDKLAVHAARAADPLLPGSPPPGEARVHNQSVL